MNRERAFWMAIRQALLLAFEDIPPNNLRRAAGLIIKAIETRYGLTPHLRK